MKKENPALRWGPARLQKEAFARAAEGKKEVVEIQMPKTASGNPKFPSRMDGAEAGIVSGGMRKRLV